ncbi:ABC transporter permease [Bacillus salipaludis]|uniref:ABC transporter permease n=1 Tax=Bacillus salipaludis TaxID=2547811 RepID=A0A4R5W024_9BACI|nr:ABC transporter permease [Bacillus salipaludis]MDQ6596371.1 ABC transporter permease [Bacillus salipaludis]TDK65147.1 ABC transporter permease [Bacillus salipaludis]
MFDEKSLWNQRFGHRLKDLGSYLRYIFNGHLVIVLVFLTGGAAFYYQKWIEKLSAGFPAELIIAVIIGLFLTYSPVYNFLLEADRVFLLPLETRLRDYFLRSGIVSLVFQGYILLMVQAVLMPMYAHVSTNGFHSFLLFYAVLLIIKAWNLVVSWKIHYFVQPSIYRWDMVVRYFINAVFTFLLFKQANFVILLVMVLVMGFYYWSFRARTRKLGLKWDLLIEQEEKRMAAFYRLANLFTDVPKLKDTVKRRRWLDLFLKRISFIQKNTYLFLFSRTFLRSSDYLGLFIRLTVIGALALYFISFGFGQIGLAVLFLYLTGFQLLPLWNHHQNKLWVDLYPVAAQDKTNAFQSLLMVILVLQAFLFALFILLKGEIVIAMLELAAGLVFSYLFVYLYSRKRVKA